VLDLDADADRGHDSALLAGSMYFWRENAPERAKFVFQCEEKLSGRKNLDAKVELLAFDSGDGHQNAVIAGVHPSGSPILWGGTTIVDLPLESVQALWEDLTGEPWERPQRETAETGDFADVELAKVASALNHIDPWKFDYGTWVGILGALHDTYGDAALSLAVSWGDGKPGEVERRWRSFGSYNGRRTTIGTIFYHAQQAGWNDAERKRQRQENLQEQLADYRQWLHSANGAEVLRDAGFVRVEVGRKGVDALIELCDEAGKNSMRVGFRRWGERFNASHRSARRLAEKLKKAGLIAVDTDTTPVTISLKLVLHKRRPLKKEVENQRGAVTQNYFYTYGEHRPHDAFLDNHAAYNRRNPDGLKPLGATALAVKGHLEAAERATAQEIAEISGLSYHAVARALRKLYDAGLAGHDVERRNRKTYYLLDNWKEDLATIAPHMTTAGVLLRRQLNNAEASLAFGLGDPSTSPERLDWLADRFNRLARLETDIENPAQWINPRYPGCAGWSWQPRFGERQDCIREAGHRPGGKQKRQPTDKMLALVATIKRWRTHMADGAIEQEMLHREMGTHRAIAEAFTLAS